MVNRDTIAAISTALGHSGIAVVRVSGPDAVNVAGKILRRKEFPEPGRMYLTSLIDSDGRMIDRVLAVRFAKPKSYTGEDVAEIHTHGGILAATTCLELAVRNGARLADPGEFTRRAFINGRIDLSQAEGVLGVIQARSTEALHAAARTLSGELSRKAHRIHDEILRLQGNLEVQLDFPEGESANLDIESGLEGVITELESLISQCSAGLILREGVRVVIAGRPNAGKSSLLNALLGKNRAIVTDIPGTTRDIIEESIIIDGIPVRLVDTAGLREADDVIEAEGVRLALEAVSEGDICLYVIDSSLGLQEEDREFLRTLSARKAIAVLNKSDLGAKVNDVPIERVYVSAKTLEGIDGLKAKIHALASGEAVLSSGLNVSARQLGDLRECLEAVSDARNAEDEDITAGLLNSARLSILRVLGLDAGDELLDSVFSRFCVGK